SSPVNHLEGSTAMKKLSLALATALLFVDQSRASIVLEFFQGTSVNDTTLSLTPFPNNTVALVPGGPVQFVEVAMHQTAPTNILTPTNGLAIYLIQGVYGPNQPGNWVVPATVSGGTAPIVNNLGYGYDLIRSYRTGPDGSMPGGNEGTATAFRFGGLDF